MSKWDVGGRRANVRYIVHAQRYDVVFKREGMLAAGGESVYFACGWPLTLYSYCLIYAVYMSVPLKAMHLLHM